MISIKLCQILADPRVMSRQSLCKTRWCQVYIYSNDGHGNIPTQLMASPSIREGILRNLEKINKLMSNPACELFPQLQLDFDLIEVLDGKCLNFAK